MTCFQDIHRIKHAYTERQRQKILVFFVVICNFTLNVNSKRCIGFSSWISSLEERLNTLIIPTNYIIACRTERFKKENCKAMIDKFTILSNVFKKP